MKVLKTYHVDSENIVTIIKSIPKKPINEYKAKKLAKDVEKIVDRYYTDEYCVSR